MVSMDWDVKKEIHGLVAVNGLIKEMM